MKKAVLLTLVMMTSALAGCIGGESGTVEVELTDEQINDLFDEHFQDFVNNSSVTHNEYVSNNYNGSGSSTTQYFVIDHIFTKSDLYGVSPAVDYMNNTFEAVYSEYNYSTNQYTNFTYQLSCIGYYLVGLQTTPVPYWNNTANYQQAWLDNHNQTIADLYGDYAYQSQTRYACDGNYNPGGSQTNTNYVDILDIEIPAGKGLRCETTAIVKMWDNEDNGYTTAYGIQYNAWNPTYTSLYFQYDSFLDGINCVSMTMGSGSDDTVYTIKTRDNMLTHDDEYRLYLVYYLVDLQDHQV